ncbi:MAG: EcsC family protein [Gloeobacterales cyanobacterium]
MTAPTSKSRQTEQISGAIKAAIEATPEVVRAVIEQGTERLGQFVAPIAEHPLIRYATKIPGIQWVMAALGQVNVEQVQQEVAKLRQQYPLETAEQLAHRVIVDTAIKAGGIGLLTNLIPPLALTLLGVDLAAMTALQAEMIYRIAAIYGFSVHEPTRRGEVLAIFGLAAGSSNLVKSGLSIVELIPIVGTVVGTTSNAALMYSLGHVACAYYEAQQKAIIQAAKDEISEVGGGL